jgi:hypothetical protein
MRMMTSAGVSEQGEAMGMSRRRLLQGSVALALSGLAPVRWVAAAGAAPGKNAGDATSWLSRSTYGPLVGTPFTFTGTGTAATLTLVGVGDGPGQPGIGGAAEGRFSLLFTSPSNLPQGTWQVRHATLGTSALFVAPVGQPASVRSYEVVVNRL